MDALRDLAVSLLPAGWLGWLLAWVAALIAGAISGSMDERRDDEAHRQAGALEAEQKGIREAEAAEARMREVGTIRPVDRTDSAFWE